MNTFEQLRSQAWHRIYLARTCPPLSILKKGGEMVERHLRQCPECRETLEITHLFAFGKKLAQVISTPSEPMKVGDIRLVTPFFAADMWFDEEGTFHNPPLVLVLEIHEDSVLVAQIHDERDLVDVGDVAVNDGVYFAEAWNIYGLPKDALSSICCARAAENDVRDVKQIAEKTFPDIDPAEALYHFRICELETGSFFSLRLNAHALAEEESEAEKSPFILVSNEKRTKFPLKNRLSELDRLTTKWQGVSSSLPLAAADSVAPRDGCDFTVRIPYRASMLGHSEKKNALSSLGMLHRDPGSFLKASLGGGVARITCTGAGSFLGDFLTAGAAALKQKFSKQDETPLTCELNVFTLENETLCTAYVRLPVRLPVIDVAVQGDGIRPTKIDPPQWLSDDTAILAVTMHFAEENPDLTSLRLSLVLSDTE